MHGSGAAEEAPGQGLRWWFHRWVGVALSVVALGVVYSTTVQLATLSVTQPISVRTGIPASAAPVAASVGHSPTAWPASTSSTAESSTLRSKPSPGAVPHARPTALREVPDPGARAQRSDERPRLNAKVVSATSRRQGPVSVGREKQPVAERAADARTAIERERRADRQLAALLQSLAAAPQGWVRPVRDAYRITATFGARGSMWSNTHTGVDLAAPTGTTVRAVAAGTVTFAASNGAYGLRVAIQHADGSETWYAHLSSIAVELGETVTQGAEIGAIGATGNVTGPHLHFELRPGAGAPVDPVQALRARGASL